MAAKKKDGQVRGPNPARKVWDEGAGKCDDCGPEPAGQKEAKYWRQKVYDHGHGYPPAKYTWIDPPTEDGQEPVNGNVSNNQRRVGMGNANQFDNDGNPILRPQFPKFKATPPEFMH
jgi:hypothetical protein